MAKDNNALATKVASANEQMTGQVSTKLRERSIANYFEQSKPEIEKALLGSNMNAERFARICLTIVRNNESLSRIAVTNPVSIIAACMEIASLGLDPAIPNEAFIIPYGQEAKQQTGYKGLAKLALRAAREQSCPLTTLTYDTICENDFYERARGDSPFVHHRLPAFGQDRGKLLGFYAVSKDADGTVNFVEMTSDEVRKHRNRFTKSPMLKAEENFEAYGLKTVVRRLVTKYLPMSNRLAQAITSDVDSENEPEVSMAPKIAAELPDIIVGEESAPPIEGTDDGKERNQEGR